MTRAQAIDLIKAKLDELPDERIDMLAEFAEAWSRKPTVYDTLSDSDKAEIDAALDELDRGKGIPWGTVKADMEAKIAASSK